MKEEKYQDGLLRAREKMQKLQDEKALEHQSREEEVRKEMREEVRREREKTLNDFFLFRGEKLKVMSGSNNGRNLEQLQSRSRARSQRRKE